MGQSQSSSRRRDVTYSAYSSRQAECAGKQRAQLQCIAALRADPVASFNELVGLTGNAPRRLPKECGYSAVEEGDQRSNAIQRYRTRPAAFIDKVIATENEWLRNIQSNCARPSTRVVQYGVQTDWYGNPIRQKKQRTQRTQRTQRRW